MMRRSSIGRARLLGFGRTVLSFLPSMLARFAGLVIICAAFLIAFAVMTGIAGDIIGATRAEIAEWRYKAEGEAAQAKTDSIIQQHGAEASLMPITWPDRAPATPPAPILAVPVEALRKTGETAFADFVLVDQLPALMAEFMGIVERTAGTDRILSKDEVLALTRKPGTSETTKINAMLNTYKIGEKGTQVRYKAVDMALQLDEMGIGISAE